MYMSHNTDVATMLQTWADLISQSPLQAKLGLVRVVFTRLLGYTWKTAYLL